MLKPKLTKGQIAASAGTVVLIVAGVAFWAFSGLPSAPSTQPEAKPSAMARAAQPQPVIAVQLARAQAGRWPVPIPASGEIAPWQESSLGFEVGGQRIAQVLVDVGDRVAKGQVLARLDTSVLEVDLASAKASLAEARANEAQALANLRRADRLSSTGGVSEQDLQAQATAHKTAQAKVEYHKAQVNRQTLQLRKAQLQAPDDGVISARFAAQGAIASAGAELFKLIRQDKLEWRAEVTASRIQSISPGQVVSLTAPNGSKVEAVVRNAAPSLSTTSRTGVVYVDLPPQSGLRAGMHVSGYISGPEQDVVMVPLTAISHRDGRAYVFSVSEGRVRAHEVTVGRSSGDQVEVTGVAPGVDVVAQGAGFLKSGDAVNVVKSQEAQ